MEPLFINPVFKQMIWGGDSMAEAFGYELPGPMTGECWAVSGHRNGDCTVKNGTYAGQSISLLWKEHRELFGDAAGEMFPLLVKIIDAKQDLSIQVHPQDSYAAENENGALGKTECWYILDCGKDAEIVIGHNASDKDELKRMIEDGEWDKLIRRIPIKKGDFFQIEPGTVHAIKGGTLILETQQSSDVTYRLYDYGRLQEGKPRELHIKKSIDVITCPQKLVSTERRLKQLENGCSLEKLVDCTYYTVWHVNVDGCCSFDELLPFGIFSVIGGEGSIDGTEIRKGDHFILPSGYGEYRLSGTMELICSRMN